MSEIEHFSKTVCFHFTGLLMGVPLMKNINELSWEKKVGWVTLSIYIATLVFCILFNGLYKGYPTTDYTPCC